MYATVYVLVNRRVNRATSGQDAGGTSEERRTRNSGEPHTEHLQASSGVTHRYTRYTGGTGRTRTELRSERTDREERRVHGEEPRSGRTDSREEHAANVEGPHASYADAIAGAVVHAIQNRLPPGTRGDPGFHFSSNRSRAHGATTFDFASDIRSTAKRPCYSPPSIFSNLRKRRKGKSAPAAKIVTYVRDVILLPMEFKNRNGEICIPRCGKRSLLGQAGLVGKVEICSDMSDEDVRREIWKFF